MTNALSSLPVMDQRKSTERVFARERRHSRNVQRLKVVLPLLAVLLMAGLVGKSAFSALTGVSIDLAGSSIEGGRLVMANPNVEGVNAQNRPYEMKAARAIQDIADSNVVDLEQIVARLPVGTSEWADITADKGIMYRELNRLDVTSPAVVKTTDGLTARFLSARLDMTKGDITSDETVEIDFDGSTARADSMHVTEGGGVMVLEHNVKLVMQSKQFRTAQAVSGDGNADN